MSFKNYKCNLLIIFCDRNSFFELLRLISTTKSCMFFCSGEFLNLHISSWLHNSTSRLRTGPSSAVPPVWPQLLLIASCQQFESMSRQPAASPPTLQLSPRPLLRLGLSLQKKSPSSPAKSTETQLQGLQEKSRGDAKLLCFNWGCV